jgi:hypothetical protein
MKMVRITNRSIETIPAKEWCHGGWVHLCRLVGWDVYRECERSEELQEMSRLAQMPPYCDVEVRPLSDFAKQIDQFAAELSTKA